MRIAILDDYQNVALRESGDVTPHPVRGRNTQGRDVPCAGSIDVVVFSRADPS